MKIIIDSQIPGRLNLRFLLDGLIVNTDFGQGRKPDALRVKIEPRNTIFLLAVEIEFAEKKYHLGEECGAEKWIESDNEEGGYMQIIPFKLPEKEILWEIIFGLIENIAFRVQNEKI